MTDAAELATQIVTAAEEHSRLDPRHLVEQRYLELCRKYSSLVSRLTANIETHQAEISLAACAAQRGRLPLALVRDGRVVLTNPLWKTLESGGGWLALRPPGGMSAEEFEPGGLPLSEVAAIQSAELWAERQSSLVKRYFRPSDSRVVELHVEAAALRLARTETIVFAHDLTEQLDREDRLLREEEDREHQQRILALGEMASGVAHDLNNLLHAATWRLESALADPRCRETQGANLQVLKRLLLDTAHRAGQLQDFARQRQDAAEESSDLSIVVRDAAAMMRSELDGWDEPGKAHIEVVVDVPSLPRVPGQPSELRGLIVNLLLNARDAMPAGGTVRLQARPWAGHVALTVEDEGPGIPPEHLTRIFDPFFTTKGRRGTGLGLSMASSIMTRLGGSIRATNRHPRGARFTLVFPLATPEETRDLTPLVSSVPRHGRVLVVDDDRDNLDAARLALKMVGQQVDLATSGFEALRYLQEHRYSLILCDIGMPEMGGWEVAARARAVAPDTPIYMLTGWAREITEADPRRRQVDGILAKPLSLTELQKLLGDHENGERHLTVLPAS